MFRGFGRREAFSRRHELKTSGHAMVSHEPATRGRGSGSISREMATALLFNGGQGA